MSVACARTELNIFDHPPTQVCMNDARWMRIFPVNPINGVNNNNPVEFVIQGTDSSYLDLNDTGLYLKIKISYSGAIAPSDFAPTNLLLSSLFDDVQVSINDKIVEGGDFMYPYKNYITTVLRYGKGYKNTQLRAAGYVKDDANKMDSKDNSGHKERESWGNTFELMGALQLGLFQQSKYIIPNTSIRLKLTRSKSDFNIMNFGSVPVQMEILNAWLRVRSVDVNHAIQKAHVDGLSRNNAIYPIQKVVMSTFTMQKGTYSETRPLLQSYKQPKLVIIGFVSNDAFHGNPKRNPFNFQNFDLSFIGLNINGQSYPAEPMKLNYGAGEYIAAYTSMIQNLEMYGKDESNAITLKDFANGYNFYVYNLTPDLSFSGCGQLYKQTNLRLDLNFEKALPCSVNCIIYALFDSVVEITMGGSIIKQQ